MKGKRKRDTSADLQERFAKRLKTRSGDRQLRELFR